jgi:superoxide dismutase, Cu-Zn family
MKVPVLMLLVSSAVFAACSQRDAPPADADSAPPPPTTLPDTPAGPTDGSATAVLAGTTESPVRGELRLTSAADGVQVVGEISGLTPGTEHGFHVHEHGDCSAPDASSAGEHLNPASAPHGGPATTPRHLGDLPNIKANEEGRADINTVLSGATLRDGGPNNLVGKAFIVHAKADDYKTQPSGDSGDRIACGVVQ